MTLCPAQSRESKAELSAKGMMEPPEVKMYVQGDNRPSRRNYYLGRVGGWSKIQTGSSVLFTAEGKWFEMGFATAILFTHVRLRSTVERPCTVRRFARDAGHQLEITG